MHIILCFIIWNGEKTKEGCGDFRKKAVCNNQGRCGRVCKKDCLRVKVENGTVGYWKNP